MRQSRDEITQNLAERLCWEVARRDNSRVARRLYRKPLVEGVYRLDEGILLDDLFHLLDHVGVMALLSEVHGTAMPREMVPFVPHLLLYGLKTLLGIESMNALPPLLFSDEALMRLLGFNAQQARDGVCQRGATKRQGARSPGPIGRDTLANHIVKLHVRDLEALFNGAIRALAKAGVLGATVTGIVDGTYLETTQRSRCCGQVTCQVRLEDERGQVHEIEVTVYGRKVLLLTDAAAKIPRAVKVGKIHAHETPWTRALVTQARTNLVGAARLHTVVFDKGFWDGTDLWWLDQQGILFVVPAKANMAVTADAQAQAAAGKGLSHRRRVHTVRPGQGRAPRIERLETEVVGITRLTTDDPYRTPEHRRAHNRRDFQPNPINAVVVRQWQGREYGPGENRLPDQRFGPAALAALR